MTEPTAIAEAPKLPIIRSAMIYKFGNQEFHFETYFPQNEDKRNIVPIIDKIQEIAAREGMKYEVVQKRTQLEQARILERSQIQDYEDATGRMIAAEEEWDKRGDRRPFRPSPSDIASKSTIEQTLKKTRELIARTTSEIDDLLGFIDGRDQCPSTPLKSSISAVK